MPMRMKALPLLILFFWNVGNGKKNVNIKRMNFSEIENWIREELIFNQNLSLNRIAKGVKLSEISLNDSETNHKEKLTSF